MLPSHPDEITIDHIRMLVRTGQFENDLFELKLQLPQKSPSDSDRLRKACCGFANSSGGYIIFGTRDDKNIGIDDRIEGLSPTIDFLEHFGVYPAKGIPSVSWIPRNPSIELPNGNLVHVIYIPKSWQAPHGLFTDGRWDFIKRTNKGNEVMSMEEIRGSFLNYYEKKVKLQLLRSELIYIRDTLLKEQSDLLKSPTSYSMMSFDTSIVLSIISETYVILSSKDNLIKCLTGIRHALRAREDLIRLFMNMMTSGMQIDHTITQYNGRSAFIRDNLIPRCVVAIHELGDFLGVEDTISDV